MAKTNPLSRPAALRFILLVGATSLFGDMTYESARSITGPFLASLGATGTIVGIVAGFGELLGYGARVFTGYWADRTQAYWRITILGYALNLFSVPLLALASSWPVASLLIVSERFGRAVRSPARDAMLSYAASQTGLGWGFGLHEAMDQLGALIGPLAVSGLLYLGYSYTVGFSVLLAPALISMAFILAARLNFPRPRDFDLAPPALSSEGLAPRIWVYLAAVALVAAGYSDFALIAYHFAVAKIVAAPWVPLLYAFAMGVAGISALALGKLFDWIGVGAMALAALFAAAAAPLLFLGDIVAAIIGIACWGIGMAAQESVMRAMIARIAPTDQRSTIYGLFNLVYGVAWFAGSALLGVLYDISLIALATTATVLQLASLPFFLAAVRREKLVFKA